MTSDERARFEEVWPGLARRLSTRLANRNVPASMREDVVQETGLRLLEMWDRVDPARPVWPLAVAIAGNLLWDDVNRTRRHEAVDGIDEVSPEDVEGAAIARSELTMVSKAMRHLTAPQRAALLAEVGASDIAAAVSADALKMLRMRARRRLRSLMQRVPAPAALWLRSRTLLADLARLPEGSAAVAGFGLYAAIVLALPITVPGGGDSPGAVTPRLHEPGLRAGAAAARAASSPDGGSASSSGSTRGAWRTTSGYVSVAPQHREAAPRLRTAGPSRPVPPGAYYVGKIGRTGPVSARASASFSPRREPPGGPTGCTLTRRDDKLRCEVRGPRTRVRVAVRVHR